ncbi:MAG TPA: hypothetical protein ENJ52_02585 [Aliiroseovarius sp.]|nr:hypothetical protein [Aliiroseovarius sp.]
MHRLQHSDPWVLIVPTPQEAWGRKPFGKENLVPHGDKDLTPVPPMAEYDFDLDEAAVWVQQEMDAKVAETPGNTPGNGL